MRLATLLLVPAACCTTLALAQVSGGSPAQGTGGITATPGPGGTLVIRRPTERTQALQQLQQSADRLRQAIQALSGQPPGAGRDQAVVRAQEALLQTQQAMLALPPELRSAGTASTAAYDESVQKLVQSSDSLHQAIREMSQLPAGEGRERAIQEAQRALWVAQLSMASAWQPEGDTSAMGAGKKNAPEGANR